MKTKMRAVIVDDEPRARSLLRRMLGHDDEVELVGECANGFEAIAAIQREKPDLIFLDVQMPELSGFDVLQKLAPERLPAIIFVTAYDQYALRAFEVHALDYLLKPFDKERFLRVLERAKNQLRAGKTMEQSAQIAELLQRAKIADNYLDRIALKENGRVVLLKVSEIDWLEAEDNYVRIHTPGGTHLLRETLSRLETKLPPDRFLRVHRSAIVNLDSVHEIQPHFHGEFRLKLKGGAELVLSRSYRDKFFQRFS